MDIIKISLLGICGVILCFFLKETRPEYTAFITMGIGIMILGLAVGKLEYLFGTLQKTAAQIELFCRLSVLVQSVPILLALLETIQEFMT